MSTSDPVLQEFNCKYLNTNSNKGCSNELDGSNNYYFQFGQSCIFGVQNVGADLHENRFGKRGIGVTSFLCFIFLL